MKFKNKGEKERRKAFKATWDDSSESEKEEEQEEVANLCFMALKDENKVPSIFNSSCDSYCECDDDDDDDDDDDNDDDDEIFIASKLMHKFTSLTMKKFYKYKFTSLTKEFED